MVRIQLAEARDELSFCTQDGATMNDPYIILIQEQWAHISDLYNQFAAEQPVMLVETTTGEIHAFPFHEFCTLLDSRSQATLAEQYARAVANRQMVLFVRDVDAKVFQSYTLALDEG